MEESNSTTIYIKDIIRVAKFSSSQWAESSVMKKVITSIDESVAARVEIFPNEPFEGEENYVSVNVKLLPSKKQCYAKALKLSILSPGNILKQEQFIHTHSQEKEASWGVPRYVLRQLCMDADAGMLDNGNLVIQVELFCMSLVEHSINHTSVPASENRVELIYSWNICDLPTFPNVLGIRLMSTLFPSNSDSVQFYLQTAPRGEFGSKDGFCSLHNCLADTYGNKLALRVNYTYTLKNFGSPYRIGMRFNWFSEVYDTSTTICQTMSSAFVYANATKRTCFTIEFRGIYVPN